MEENKIIKIDSVDLIKHVPSRFRELMGSVIKINELGIFNEHSCAFCSSKYRTEAESIFLKTPQYQNDKYDNALKFLIEKGENFSIDVVKNHCNSHINQGESQLRKIEYINTIDNIASVKQSTLEEVDIMLAALKERLIETNKIVGDSRTSKIDAEVIKSNVVTQISKSFSSLLKLRSELLGEMKSTGEMILIDRGKFKQVFNNALDNAKNEEEKNIIVSLLKNLSKSEDKSSI
jgi:hypothetical protein